MELFSVLGLDLKIFIAQFINFALLGFILYKIGYKPIIKFVQDRTATIEQGVKNSEAAKTALERADAEHTRIIAAAKNEANALLEKANHQAQQQGEQLVARSQQQAQHVIEKAKQDIRLEHRKMLADAKSELAIVVVLATEKLLQHKIDTPADQALAEKIIADVKVGPGI